MHRPTHAIFAFYPREGLPTEAFVTLENFEAQLVHVCHGQASPWGFELERLCREAAIVGLSFLGYVRLIRVSDYTIGEESLASDGSR
jgi:hypothetical protein